MSKIQYVCLSDLHLGEEGSLLTNVKLTSPRKPRWEVDPTEASPVLKALVDCLHHLVHEHGSQHPKPTLILNGDILELALCTIDKAAMTFARFIKLLMPKGNEFGHVIFIPGNHDHHLWETARERQYVVNYLEKVPTHDVLARLRTPSHTTKMFFDYQMPNDDRTFCRFLMQIVECLQEPKKRRRPEDPEGRKVVVAYPNFGIRNNEGSACVIFHHGHFVENVYRLMSIFMEKLFPENKSPKSVWAWEEGNFAWIDFFWSAMGRSGVPGEGVERIYETLHDPDARKELSNRAARAALRTLAQVESACPEEEPKESWFRDRLLPAIAGWLGDERERQRGELPLSLKTKRGLDAYMEGPLLNQILHENQQRIPKDVTFVFGHTHKPFQCSTRFDYYQEEVSVLNTGGWVVDGREKKAKHGGAIALIDQDLNAVNLRMYTEEDYEVSVKEAAHQGTKPSAFRSEIEKFIKSPNEKEPWDSFSKIVKRAVEQRRNPQGVAKRRGSSSSRHP